ncbi:MAG TPA: hypothetical protein VFZ48_03730 [Candidatus Saccharimonadales bacterium]
MTKWWQAPRTEQELLDRLYGFTHGFFVPDPTYAASSDPIPWGGYEEARSRAAKPNYLRRYRSDITLRIGKFGLLPIPGAQLVTAPVRLKYSFGAMAGAAWANGYTKGVGPKNEEEAKYDLLAITTVWVQQQQKLGVADIASLPTQDTGDIKALGKRFLYVLAQNGALKIGKRTLGDVMGPLSAIAFSQEILPALGEELLRAFKEELFRGVSDEFIPGIASVTSVSRAWTRLDTFHGLAQKYYTYRQKN